MRKLFSLIAAVLFAGSMMATEVTVSKTVEELATANSWANGTVVTPFALDEVITVSTDATDVNTGKYYTSGQQVRLYQTGAAKLIVTAAEGYTISSITLTYVSQNTGIFVEAESGVAVDFENVQSATFTVGNSGAATNGQARVTAISVTYNGEGGVTPPPADTYTVAGNDAAIFGEAWNPALTANDMTLTNGIYTWEKDGLNLTAGTIQFKVVKNHSWDVAYPAQNYEVSIAEDGEYTITITFDPSTEAVAAEAVKKEAPAAISCLEVYQKAKNDAVLLNPVTVTYSNGANVWVMDGSASMLIYLPSGFTNNFQAGDVLSGIAGVVDIYQNIVYEVKPDATQAAAIVATPGEAPAPSQAAVIEASDVNKYVILPGFSIEGAFTADSKTSLPAVLGENTITIYNNFKFAYTFEAGKTYDIIGVVSAYKGNPQVYFISAEEAGGEVPPTPSINYYVAGSMGVWGPDEAYRLTPSNNGEYEGEFTFAANDEFKVIGYDGTTVTWFPDGMNNNYVITEAGDYKITFNPAGNVDGWYAGFFNVVKKEAPIVHQYEVAEAIAAGLQENDEVLVRGVITKIEFKGANFAKFGSVNIYVADATDAEGEFEFFNCYSLNADTFRTSIPNYDPTDKTWAQFNEVADENGNTIHVGDTVIAFGKYKLYNSTHELNTGCYLVDIKHAPQQPGEEITIDIESEVQYTDYVAEAGWWQFMAENDEYDISISNVSTTQAAGTYTIADLDADYTYVFIKADSTKVYFVDGEFTLTEGEDGSRTIEGVMTGDDGNIYNIKLVFRIPTPETTVNVEIPEWGVADAAEIYYYTGTLFYGYAADSTYIQFVVLGNNPIGTFTYDDMLPTATGIEVGGKYKPIYSMDVTVNASDAQRAIITMDILCLNNTLYHVTTHIGEGINAVEAAEKAVKMIQNGNVVIIKNGVHYNVNGQVIK
ncbi:MAG: hypothetical protein IKG86_00090 [Paludibacteraceae bacterium]|nr:hypothetical protein [Paludibacteraceae bacterium]